MLKRNIFCGGTAGDSTLFTGEMENGAGNWAGIVRMASSCYVLIKFLINLYIEGDRSD
jgi:hypothetical protein